MELYGEIVYSRCGFTIRTHISAHFSEKLDFFTHIFQLWSSILQTQHEIKILRSVLQKQSSFLLFYAGRAHIGPAVFVQKVLEWKTSLGPPTCTFQIKRYTKTAFETGLFVSRQRDFFPGGGGTWHKPDTDINEKLSTVRVYYVMAG